jgi:hypothetical protein
LREGLTVKFLSNVTPRRSKVPPGLTSAPLTFMEKVGGLPLAADHHLGFCPVKSQSIGPHVFHYDVEESL